MHRHRHLWISALTGALALALSGCPETVQGCESGFEMRSGRCVPIGVDAQIPDTGVDAGPPCGGCTDSARPVCDTESMTCVQCTGDTHCGGATPHCNTDDHTCVACVDDGHCSAPTPTCGSDHVCFGCTNDEQCTSPDAARCELGTGACVPCDDSSQCTGIIGRTVCDMSAESGVCVECNRGDEMACGAARTCNLLTKACVDVGPGDVGVCEACTNDRQCGADHRCILMDFAGAPRGMGYCLQVASIGCERPFRASINRASISEVPAEDYCGINEMTTSCEAVNALLAGVECPGGTNEECPGPGALCRDLPVVGSICTYPCSIDRHCPDPSFDPDIATCGPGSAGAPNFCGG